MAEKERQSIMRDASHAPPLVALLVALACLLLAVPATVNLLTGSFSVIHLRDVLLFVLLWGVVFVAGVPAVRHYATVLHERIL